MLNQRRKAIKQGINNLGSDKALISKARQGLQTRKNPADLAIAARMLAEAGKNRAGSSNAAFFEARANTADAALGQATEITGRLNELAVMASDGTLNDSDRAALNAEAQQLTSELSNIQSNTRFNGQAVLQGGDVSTVVGSKITAADADLTAANATLGSIDLSTQAGAQGALSTISTGLNEIITERAKVGSSINRIQSASDLATQQAAVQEGIAADLQNQSFTDLISGDFEF